MKKALHIVLNNFSNDSRVLKECTSLHKTIGIDVTVYALHEGILTEREKSSFGQVQRFKLKTRAWSKRKPVQLLKYFECWVLMAKEAWTLKPDIVHAHDLEALPIGRSIAKRLNIPFIYDAHEFETEMSNQGKIKSYLYHMVEKKYIHQANAIITVSNSIAEAYAKLYNISKPYLILNCPPYQRVPRSNLFRETFKIPDDHLIFVYQGGLTEDRGILQLLQAFSELQDIPADLVIMGYGEMEALIVNYSQKYNNIHFKPAVPAQEIIKWTTSAEIGVCNIENTSLSYYYCLPNKIFEYIMAGIPILASNLHEISNLILPSNAGWIINQNTTEEIIAAISKIVSKEWTYNPGEVQRLSNIYNWEAQEKILCEIYRKILN